MKKIFMSVMVIFPLFAFAQDMEKMMQAMQQMQTCMQAIDQSELEQLEQQSLKLQQDIKSLCASGNSAEAQRRAVAFGLSVSQSASMQQMSKCAELMAGMIPANPYAYLAKDYSNVDICAQ